MVYALLRNPNKHYYTTRQKKVRLIGLHVTAGLQDLGMEGLDNSAENTNKYGATTTRAASWHKIVDSDGIEDAIPDEYTAFHIRGYNSMSLGLEICNLDARWDNKPKSWIDATLLNAARVCLKWEKKFDIPRRLLTKKEVDAGERGYSYHMFLDPSRRRDPGTTFPWDHFVDILEALDKGNTTEVPLEDKPSKPALNDPKTSLRLKVDGDFGDATTGRLQESLNRTGAKPKLAVDGDFGDRTKRALQARLNRTNGPVSVDGDVGPRTVRALQRNLGFTGAQVDGDWGPATTKQLQRVLNKREL